MSKRWIVLTGLAVFFCVNSVVFAETIYLKTGKKIRAQILERDDKKIKVDISGVKITYYMDEIDRIEDADNQPAAAAQSNPPVEPSPVAAPSSAPVPSPALTPVDLTVRTDSKKALILDLVEASGTKDTMSQMFTQIIDQSPSEQKASLKTVLNVDEIIPRLVPVYDKYFSEDELKELIAFYKGATGRKLIKVMPLIMEDSMKATESYFQEKMPAPNQDGAGPVPDNDSKGSAATYDGSQATSENQKK